MDKGKWVLRIGQAIIFLFALLWIIAGIAGFTPGGYSASVPVWMIRAMAVAMLLYGLILVGVGIGLASRRKLFYYLAVGLLAVGGLMTIFDDFGAIDLLVLLMAATSVIYFVANKRWFVQIK
jgi:lysylphosphatidylglycerol synthetase-like protein (DUF2156 family)